MASFFFEPADICIQIKVLFPQEYSTHIETSALKDKVPTLNVLFLHGAKFTSQNWIQIDVLDSVASWGYMAIAVDLPGILSVPFIIVNNIFGEAFLSVLIIVCRCVDFHFFTSVKCTLSLVQIINTQSSQFSLISN